MNNPGALVVHKIMTGNHSTIEDEKRKGILKFAETIKLGALR